MTILKIEGFTVHTSLMSVPETVDCLMAANIIRLIEDVIIAEMPIGIYSYEHSHGYKQRSREPFRWSEGKMWVKMIYTGSFGGESWWAKVYK